MLYKIEEIQVLAILAKEINKPLPAIPLDNQIKTAFLTQENNTVPVLSKQFNVTQNYVHKVLNKIF